MRKSLVLIAAMLMVVGASFATTIVGTVVDSNGEAVDGAYVTVMVCDSTGQHNGRGGEGRGHGRNHNGEPGVPPEGIFNTETAEDGTFEILDVVGGNYVINAMLRGFGGIHQEIIVPEDGIFEVELQLPFDGEREEWDQRREERGNHPRRPHRIN